MAADDEIDELGETHHGVSPALTIDRKYELVRLLGRGGMGTVWEARHLRLGMPVAVKLIEADLVTSTEARRRFEREAWAAAKIDSKHAIKIFDTGVAEDGRPYIVMELLKGETLGQRLQKVGTLTLEQADVIVTSLARALGRAHELGIVHRDLKPDNVFLAASDMGELVKLLDFGIAKVLEELQDLSLSSRTMAGAAIGTPQYMSPEQARGLATVDHRTDLWSLAVVVFRALTGRDLFEGAWPGPLMVQICELPLPFASAVAPSLPPAIDAWFFRALARDPRERFQSAEELARHFSEIVGRATGRPHAALPPPIEPDDLDETGTARLVDMHPSPQSRTLRMQVPASVRPPLPTAPSWPPPNGSSAPAVMSVPPPSSSTMKAAPRARSGALILGVAAGGVCLGVALGLGVGAAVRAPQVTSLGAQPFPNMIDAARDAAPASSADGGRQHAR